MSDYSLDAQESALIGLINQHRAQNGLGPLASHDDLNRTATWKSTDMGTSATFSHVDSLGRTAYLRAVECGYSVGAGENIAAGYSWDTAAEIFDAWKASVGHNNNMLGSAWRDIGVARVYVSGSPYGWYWSAEFGAGEPAAPTPTSTPTAIPGNTSTPTATATATSTPTTIPTSTIVAPSATPTMTAATASPTRANTATATPTRKAKGPRR